MTQLGAGTVGSTTANATSPACQFPILKVKEFCAVNYTLLCPPLAFVLLSHLCTQCVQALNYFLCTTGLVHSCVFMFVFVFVLLVFFSSQPGSGSFVRPKKVSPGHTFIAALKEVSVTVLGIFIWLWGRGMLNLKTLILAKDDTIQ